MEDNYFKARRSYVGAAGLLLAWVFFDPQLVASGALTEPLSIFGLKFNLSNTSNLKYALLVALIYLAYRAQNDWSLAHVDSRASRLDILVVHAIAIIALMFFASSELLLGTSEAPSVLSIALGVFCGAIAVTPYWLALQVKRLQESRDEQRERITRFYAERKEVNAFLAKARDNADELTLRRADSTLETIEHAINGAEHAYKEQSEAMRRYDFLATGYRGVLITGFGITFAAATVYFAALSPLQTVVSFLAVIVVTLIHLGLTKFSDWVVETELPQQPSAEQ